MNKYFSDINIDAFSLDLGLWNVVSSNALEGIGDKISK